MCENTTVFIIWFRYSYFSIGLLHRPTKDVVLTGNKQTSNIQMMVMLLELLVFFFLCYTLYTNLWKDTKVTNIFIWNLQARTSGSWSRMVSSSGSLRRSTPGPVQGGHMRPSRRDVTLDMVCLCCSYLLVFWVLCMHSSFFIFFLFFMSCKYIKLISLYR